MDPLTPDETLAINGRRVTASQLARARQQLAAESPFNAGFYDWDALPADEQQGAELDAAGWLRAIGRLLADAEEASHG